MKYHYRSACDRYTYFMENCFTSSGIVLHWEERIQAFSVKAEQKENQYMFILSMLEGKYVVISTLNSMWLKLPEMLFTAVCCFHNWECSKIVFYVNNLQKHFFPCPEKSQRQYIVMFIP